MNPLPDDSSLRDRFRELRERDVAGTREFVCILDVRHARRNIDAGPRLRALACAMLGSAAALIAGLWIAMRPAPALKLDAAAMQLAAWESPTSFLLAADFSPATQN